MITAKICPVCGKPAIPDAPQGLCPECLMKSGFDTQGPGEAGGGAPAFVPPPVEQLARLFPQFEILELLGHGGMGAVYKVRQPALDRLAALKILPPRSAKDPGFAERFNREARALARLSHPNIVAVYDFGQAVDIPYFLMEYVEGRTLRQIVRSGKLSPADTLQVVMQICEALQFAHGEGVVHRDIKPENILLDQKGRVKIADFGIAKVLRPPAQDIALTGARDVVGTAPYMAPEQLENPQTVDHRADIFSLGVVFYELLTGELPLGKFQSPSQKVQVDVRLDEVVLHTLEKEPARRYQQAKEVKTDVETIAATPGAAPPAGARRPPPPRGPSPGARERPLTSPVAVVAGVIGLAAVLLLLVVAGVMFARIRNSAHGPAAAANPAKLNDSLLNEDQRLFVRRSEQRFHELFDGRTFQGWIGRERSDLERRMLDTLQGPRTAEFFRAISTLGALRSTNAVAPLRAMAFERVDKLLRTEVSNRRRWMATRALGQIGDPRVVPELIHLLYHNDRYVRWWAQVSLVRLTGRNYGGDWNAWGRWWIAQRGQPPYDAQPIRWWKGQAEPDELAKSLAESDRAFVKAMKGVGTEDQLPLEADESDAKTSKPPQ